MSCRTNVQDLERSANKTESRLKTFEVENRRLAKEVQQLKEKTEAMENHSQKFNLRIIGLPNVIEAGKPTQFTTALLYESFGEDALGPMPLISVAHHIGPVAGRKRPMIIRVHSLDVKCTILRMKGEDKHLFRPDC